MRRTLLVTSLVVVGAILTMPFVAAQEMAGLPRGGRSDTARASTIGFERILNTFLWNGHVFVEHGSGPWTVLADQRLRSRLIRVGAASLQDDYAGSIRVLRNLGDGWFASGKMSGMSLSDNRASDLGKLVQVRMLPGLGYAWAPGREVSAHAGAELNTQDTEDDRGFSFDAAGSLENLAFEQARASVASAWSQSLLGRRRPHDGFLRADVATEFGGQGSDSLQVAYVSSRREFYTPADSTVRRQFDVAANIFTRESHMLEVNNQLRYAIGGSASITVQGGLANMTIDRGYRHRSDDQPLAVPVDTRIQEFHLRGAVVVDIRPSENIELSAGLMYHEREERHTLRNEEAIPDVQVRQQESAVRRLENASHTTSMHLGGTVLASDRYVVRFVSSARLLQYDRPDTNTTDDRDELLFSFGLEHVFTVNRWLRLAVAGDATLNHLVYVHRLQSANNNWNRVFRISPRVEFEPSRRFSTVLRSEVMANYTVYDFEEQVASVRSFSFRQALWSDSTVVYLTRRLRLDLLASLRLFERGILRWKDFTERPEHAFVEHSVWMQWRWEIAPGLSIGSGYRYFIQDKYRYAGRDKVFESSLSSSGPTATMAWSGPMHSRMTIDGWLETQRVSALAGAAIPNLSIAVSFFL